MSLRNFVVIALALSAVGCQKKVFTEAVTLHAKVDRDGNDLPNSAEVLDPHTLTNGYEAYMLYCYACHGQHGDGFGPAAPTMRPPPRNLTRGVFKFPGNEFGQLPTDNALDRTIRRGLHGTPMLPWDIPAVERKAIIAYLKTLSPRWTEEGVKPEIEIAPDPWRGKSKAEAVKLGQQVYQIAQDGAGCSGCHASYMTKQEVYELSLQATPDSPVTEFAEEPNRSALKESEYPTMWRVGERLKGCDLPLGQSQLNPDELAVQVNGQPIDRDPEHKKGWDYVAASAQHDEKAAHGHHAPVPTDKVSFFGEVCDEIKKDIFGASVLVTRSHQILPPDLLFHRVKTAYPVGTMVNEGTLQYVMYTEEMQREDLYRTIGVGIGGAAMPGWKGVLEEDKLWALVYYVQSLIELRDTPAALALRDKLTNQPAFVPPAPAESAPDAGM